jgi:hypothetical protein
VSNSITPEIIFEYPYNICLVNPPVATVNVDPYDCFILLGNDGPSIPTVPVDTNVSKNVKLLVVNCGKAFNLKDDKVILFASFTKYARFKVKFVRVIDDIN